jgi:hypothetical protein
MKAFVCHRTGLMYPPDYAEQWGKKYGHGLGPTPVSEALVNLYDYEPSEARSGQRMYSVGQCYGGLSLIEVSQEEFDKNKAVLMIDDPGLAVRGPLMLERQINNNRVDRINKI